jgi:catechol 2,3-dioxygenase-like lactoylglutathione lyase family enzyme
MSELNATVKRTTLLVNDLKRSVEFFSAIGFSEWQTGSGLRDPNANTHLPLAGKSTKFDFVIMSGEHPVAGMIGLLEYSKPALPSAKEAGGFALGIGDVVLVIGTNDIHLARRRLGELGATILHEPKEWGDRSDPNSRHGAMMMFLDPEGRVIELMQDGPIRVDE